ncbi:polysaccharide pyruvyl transferase family protein [Actinopolymorpha sp. B17G11]|uniref:polysaccharide pyruvyl transferase family protein n=1 Tax=Actinopolymorpha sp. B17G11 TaxID=3160861 RepID=UPI0032E37E33
MADAFPGVAGDEGVAGPVGGDDAPERARILVRSLWQTVNIGDVAHAPGTLRALQRHGNATGPGVDLSLWVQRIDDRERAMLERFFPAVRLVEGDLDERGEPTTPELQEEFERADLLLHGPAASFGAEPQVRLWSAATGKPYGIFGVTVDPVTHPDWGTLDDLATKVRALPAGHLRRETRRLLDEASFVFCRDTLSLEYLEQQGVTAPVLGFGPDATFMFDVHDDAAATLLLEGYDLAAGDFVCVIPRLRYTPYYRIRGTEPTAEDLRRDELNATFQDRELSKLRDLVTAVVRQTGRRVLLCPEMIYAVELARTELWEKLPADVQSAVIALPYYWAAEEAAAVYARAHSVVSMECHSPIMSVVAGTPTVYLRQPTDTIKGQMWADLGLADSILELDDLRAGELEDFFQHKYADYQNAVESTARGRERAQSILGDMVATALDAATGVRHSRQSQAG